MAYRHGVSTMSAQRTVRQSGNSRAIDTVGSTAIWREPERPVRDGTDRGGGTGGTRDEGHTVLLVSRARADLGLIVRSLEDSLAHTAGCRGADPLVARCRRVPDLPAQLRRLRWRRHRRSARHPRPPRPPGGPGRRRGVAVADLPLAAGRQRLRRQRLPRRRPDVRDPRRSRRVDRRSPSPRHEAGPGPRREPHVRSASVVPRVTVFPRPRRGATGTGGGRRAPACPPAIRAPSRRTGARSSPAPPGSSTRPAASTTCTCSRAVSPTSTGSCRPCARPCTR